MDEKEKQLTIDLAGRISSLLIDFDQKGVSVDPMLMVLLGHSAAIAEMDERPQLARAILKTMTALLSANPELLAFIDDLTKMMKAKRKEEADKI